MIPEPKPVSPDAIASAPAPGSDDPAGVVCRHCGCRHLPVNYTRHHRGFILRVRECRHCGRRPVTRESEL